MSGGLSVVVVGAGAAGLCAARYLAATGKATPHVFELSDSVGGTWVYTDRTGIDDRGDPIFSSMYTNLRTNLPKEVMSFPDFPFKDSIPESFIHHSQVLEYLREYAAHWGLHKYITFNKKIETIQPNPQPGKKWEVRSVCQLSGNSTKEYFDGVMVCNGKNSVPTYPNIPGLDKFTGTILHSHDYRLPSCYRGRNVLVLGAGPSGTDISMELSPVANQVYLSHHGVMLPTKLPNNVAQVSGLRECIGASAFLLADGSKVQCHDLILATGYEITFPFLSPNCGISVNNRQIRPLYKHFLNIEHPSMCLIGIPTSIAPFPQFSVQVRYFIRMLLGETPTPSKQEMLQDTERDRVWRLKDLGMKEHHLHKMGDLQWEYNREICRLADIPPVAPVVEKLYKEVHARRMVNLPGYKQDSFRIVDSETFVEQDLQQEPEQ